MRLFSDERLEEACDACNVAELRTATIGEILLVAAYLEKQTGISFIRMEQGSPGLPINTFGVQAEKEALDSGICAQYPPADGIPQLKEAAARFVKGFLDIDVSAQGCIPTTGSVEASFGAFIACTQRIPGKDKVLFIDPGFPIQKSQLRMLGINWKSFDIYPYRGAAKLRAKLEEELASGDIAAIVYSNPNNPAWICLEEGELRVIGELSSAYDVIVMEDMAYFCMDYRRDFGRPYEPPFPPTVARYTDNWMLMLSASKIFSYAGQRIAVLCVSDKLYLTYYQALANRYCDSGVFGVTLSSSILYMITSGCTHSTQYAYARMLDMSCDGNINFVEDTREYARRAHRMKAIFLRHGFHIVYGRDVTAEVGDGFFFSLGYGNMDGGELLRELLAYGVSSISLSTTGSEKGGVRACVSRMREDQYSLLEERMADFEADHPH